MKTNYFVLFVCAGGVLFGMTGCAGRFQKQGGPPPDAAIKVRVHTVAPEPRTQTLTAAATLLPDESVLIKSETEGRILEIGFREGDRVEPGQLLFRLDPEKLAAALREAEAAFELAALNRERAAEMLRRNVIAQQEYDTADSAYNARRATVDLLRKQLQDSEIRAPFSGVAGPRLVSSGQMVGRLAPLVTVMDTDPIKIEFRVPERWVRDLREGLPVSLRVAAWPDREFDGRVTFVSPEIEPASRSVLVRAEAPNPAGDLRPGMFARVALTLGEDPNALLVPDIAVFRRGNSSFVYVVGEDTRVALREIRIGARESGRAVVLSGLQAGEMVVTEGHQKLVPGARADHS